MDCAVCGNELLGNRAVFHCSCGVYLHAHCWNNHVLQAHQPEFTIGVIDLNGEFKLNTAQENNDEEIAAASTTTEQPDQTTE